MLKNFNIILKVLGAISKEKALPINVETPIFATLIYPNNRDLGSGGVNSEVIELSFNLKNVGIVSRSNWTTDDNLLKED
ncbi:hypothetical protein [Niabella aurantiaca]|uniref:hypothetical protein n=1 Tax=Niabella aurantiaca TaxID=379900 RepID=UPI00035FD94D|nr:hypothetical protein [Niabella aurantiaca]